MLLYPVFACISCTPSPPGSDSTELINLKATCLQEPDCCQQLAADLGLSRLGVQEMTHSAEKLNLIKQPTS